MWKKIKKNSRGRGLQGSDDRSHFLLVKYTVAKQCLGRALEEFIYIADFDLYADLTHFSAKRVDKQA